MSTPVLATKLFIPPAPPAVVSRARLLDHLNEGLSRRLTLVSAPAGFGKTTLVSEWLGGLVRHVPEMRVAWLSLDEGESDAVRFLDYLVAALQTAVPGVGEDLRRTLEASPLPPGEGVLTGLLNEVAAVPGGLVLVLDDYHAVEGTAVDELLAFMLEYLPPRVHYVLLTREDPGLPVARLRARGQMTEVRAVDLRFTAAEAADFLTRVMGLDLTEADVSALEVRTEGWIAGLQMAALALQATARQEAARPGGRAGEAAGAAFIEAFTGSHRFVMDYLMDEVLRRQPGALRGFLLRTSILDRLCGPLCDAVTGAEDGRQTLESLERGNLFVVPLDGERRWYRYHHLFADVLRARLLADLPDEAPSLHTRASAWYEGEGLRAEAIRHALAAGDFELAADLVELAGPMVEQTAQARIWWKWVTALPDDVVRRRPVLSGWCAYTLLGMGELEAAEARLVDAERLLQSADGGRVVVADEEWFRLLPATIGVSRAYMAQALGRVSEAIQHAERVLELIPEGEQIRRMQASGLLGMAYWSMGDLQATDRVFTAFSRSLRLAGNLIDAMSTASILPDVRMATGHIGEAEATLRELLDFVTDAGGDLPPEASDLFRGLGELALERGESRAAHVHLLKARELSEQGDLRTCRYRTYLAQARLCQTLGDWDGALALLDEAEPQFVRSPLPEFRSVVALRAQVWAAQGRVAEALQWAAERGLSPDDEFGYSGEFEHLTLAKALLARHDAAPLADSAREALGLLERLLAGAHAGGRTGTVIEILAMQALAHRALGSIASALASLTRALILAAPEGYVRPFLDGGPAMARLLREAVLRRAEPEAAGRLLAAFAATGIDSAPTGGAADSGEELLSRREAEVLRHIAAGLTNQEIASRLYLSLYTVKAHARTIYDKLGAHTRTGAVAKAREVGILPPV
jgi:LuxR family transcriptional regulator, maltose regulon positive regulatory protein